MMPSVIFLDSYFSTQILPKSFQLVGPSLGSTLRKIEHSFIYFTPMLWMKVLVSEVLVNTFTLVCCIGMVIFCTTLKIVTLIWSTVLSILEGKAHARSPCVGTFEMSFMLVP